MIRLPLVSQLVSQTRALDNARAASTALARRRVEREEVEIFLARLADARRDEPAPARATS